VVESQPSKLLVAGSIPVSRSKVSCSQRSWWAEHGSKFASLVAGS
jgi:hypothetical protein